MLQAQETIVYPVRVVKSVGEVAREENLRIPKSLALIPSFNEEETTCLTKSGEENPFVILDFGKEMQGGIRIVFEHVFPIEQNIRIVFGESVSECLSTVGKQGANNPSAARDIVVRVANLSIRDFGRQGFRFVKIEMLDQGSIYFKSVAAIAKTEPFQQIGYVRTNDELVNKIFDTATYTCFVNAQEGVIWDGIKRDRLVWSGDLNTEILTLAYTYGAIPNIKNCLQILRDESPKGKWMNGIPTYSVWWIVNLVDYYLISGDRAFAEESAAFVNEILTDLEICVSEEKIDFFKTGKHTDMPFFLDWPTFETPDAYCGVAMLILYAMQKLEKAKIAGVNLVLAEKIAARLKKHTADEATKKQVLAFQALCGDKKVKAELEAGGARGFSTFMSYFLFKALHKCGSEEIVELIKTYYGGMLSRGATTFWEDFNIDWLENSGRIDEETPEGLRDIHADYGDFCYQGLKHSLCHGWASGVVGFMAEDILGVQIVEPGFKKVRIQPNLMGLKWAEGKIPTPYGEISVRIEEGKTPEITLPDGVEIEE